MSESYIYINIGVMANICITKIHFEGHKIIILEENIQFSERCLRTNKVELCSISQL